MSHEPFWTFFRADLERHWVYHRGATRWRKLRLAMEVDGLWAMATYRWARALKTRPRSALSSVGELLSGMASLGVRLATGIHLDSAAKIGPGFYIGHFGSIYVGPGVTIGKNSSISQMCFVGAAGPEDVPGTPVLGERVYLGAGAKVLGPVTVGDGAAIGANAVVVTDIPEQAVATGVPASVVSHKGSGDFIYLGVDNAPRAANG
jgi:serine O-acetyltransferase